MSRTIYIKPYLKTASPNTAIVIEFDPIENEGSENIIHPAGKLIGVSQANGEFKFYPYVEPALTGTIGGEDLVYFFNYESFSEQNDESVFEIFAPNDTNFLYNVKISAALFTKGQFRGISNLVHTCYDYNSLMLSLDPSSDYYDMSDEDKFSDYLSLLDSGAVPITYKPPILFHPDLDITYENSPSTIEKKTIDFNGDSVSASGFEFKISNPDIIEFPGTTIHTYPITIDNIKNRLIGSSTKSFPEILQNIIIHDDISLLESGCPIIFKTDSNSHLSMIPEISKLIHDHPTETGLNLIDYFSTSDQESRHTLMLALKGGYESHYGTEVPYTTYMGLAVNNFIDEIVNELKKIFISSDIQDADIQFLSDNDISINTTNNLILANISYSNIHSLTTAALLNINYTSDSALDNLSKFVNSAIVKGTDYPISIEIDPAKPNEEYTFEWLAISAIDPTRRYVGNIIISGKTTVPLNIPANDKYIVYLRNVRLNFAGDIIYSKSEQVNFETGTSGPVYITEDLISSPIFLRYSVDTASSPHGTLTFIVDYKNILNNPLICKDISATIEIYTTLSGSTALLGREDISEKYEYSITEPDSDIGTTVWGVIKATDRFGTEVSKESNKVDVSELRPVIDTVVPSEDSSSSYDDIGFLLVEPPLSIDPSIAFANSSPLLRWYVEIGNVQATTHDYQNEYTYTYNVDIPSSCKELGVDYSISTPYETWAEIFIDYNGVQTQMSAFSVSPQTINVDVKNNNKAKVTINIGTSNRAYTPIIHWVKPVFIVDNT